MKKRLRSVISLLLMVLMACTVFAGCGGTKQLAPAQSSAPEQQSAQTSKPAEQPKADFPKGDISVLIPAAAGGGNDLTVRALIPGLKEALGTNIIPVNQPAGKGGVAFTEVANAKPDGHKLYFNSKTVLLMKYTGIAEAQIEKLVPVAQVAEDVTIFYVRADSPWNSINDLIDHLKTSKEKLKTGNTGLGGVWHLPQIKFNKAIGVDNMKYVAYPSGSTAMLTALVAGEIDLVTCGPEGRSFVESGKVKPLAVIYPTRYPSFPDVPTVKEAAGLDIEHKVWRGFFTTAGTDEATLKILSDACKKAVESEEFKKYAAVGMLASYKDYKEFAQVVENERKELEVIMPEIMKQIEAENQAGGK